MPETQIELMRPPDEHQGTDTAMSRIQRKNIEAIKNRLQNRQKVPGFMLDMCLRTSPQALFEHLDDEQIEDKTWRNIAARLIKSSILGDSTEDSWYYLTPYLSRTFSITDSFRPNRTPLQDFDTFDFDIDPPESPKDLALEIFWQTVKRLQLKHGLLYSRLIAKDEIAGSGSPYSTPEIVRTFVENNDRLMSNFLSHTEPYFFNAEGSDCKTANPEVIIIIPVAAGQERETLPKTLEALAHQSLHPDLFKVWLLHNTKEEANTPAADEEAWMEEFYSDLHEKYPSLRFIAAHVGVISSTPIGYLRLLGHMLAMQRYLDNGAQNNPLMLNLDADITSLNHDFLSNLHDEAERSEKPVVASRLIWDTKEIRRQAPTATKLLQLNYFLARCKESINQTATFYDCGTGIKLRDYCLSGGHSWYDMFYETGNIPMAISTFKKYDGDLKKVVAGSAKSRYKTSPRRQLDTMLRGFMHDKAWDRDVTTFGELDDAVRTSNADLEKLEQICQEKLELWLQEMIELYIGTIHSDAYKQKRETINAALKILKLPSLFEIQTTNKENFENASTMRIAPEFADAIIDPDLSNDMV